MERSPVVTEHQPRSSPTFSVRHTVVNGSPALISYVGRSPLNVLTFDISEGRIEAIRIVVKPEKLGAVPPLSEPGEKGGQE